MRSGRNGIDRPIRVLVVEGDDNERELTLQVLRLAEDLEVTAARDGLEGLEKAWSERPDVIVLELVLYGISGVELLRRYRSEGGKARVLVLTRAGKGMMLDAALAAGAEYVMLKPAQWSEVLRTVRYLAGGLTRRCGELLLEMGVDPEAKGFRQTARCAGLLAERKAELLKEVYIQTASEDGGTVESIEVNVRRIAGKAHEKQSALYRELFGRQEKRRGRPNNKDFLYTLAEAARFRL